MYLKLKFALLSVVMGVVLASAVVTKASEKKSSDESRVLRNIPKPYYEPSVEEQIRLIEESGWREAFESHNFKLSRPAIVYLCKEKYNVPAHRWPLSDDDIVFFKDSGIEIPKSVKKVIQDKERQRAKSKIEKMVVPVHPATKVHNTSSSYSSNESIKSVLAFGSPITTVPTSCSIYSGNVSSSSDFLAELHNLVIVVPDNRQLSKQESLTSFQESSKLCQLFDIVCKREWEAMDHSWAHQQ